MLAWEMIISTPGTYTLTDDLYCTDGKGIYINANDVILNGDGHTIYCTGASPGDGIYSSGKSNITIKNCVIKDFRFGMYLKSGSDSQTSVYPISVPEDMLLQILKFGSVRDSQRDYGLKLLSFIVNPRSKR